MASIYDTSPCHLLLYQCHWAPLSFTDCPRETQSFAECNHTPLMSNDLYQSPSNLFLALLYSIHRDLLNWALSYCAKLYDSYHSHDNNSTWKLIDKICIYIRKHVVCIFEKKVSANKYSYYTILHLSLESFRKNNEMTITMEKLIIDSRYDEVPKLDGWKS